MFVRKYVSFLGTVQRFGVRNTFHPWAQLKDLVLENTAKLLGSAAGKVLKVLLS